MSRRFYFDCSSGISGDMTVAALLDMGADRQVLQRMLDSLAVDGFRVSVRRVKKAGIEACDFSVELDETHENHDHDMAWLHGRAGDTAHGAEEDTPHGHHHHSHRSLKDILQIIDSADMTDRARQLAVRMFTILGEAEAQAHGVELQQVHFHEVGAVDSIVDILSVAVCADSMGMEEAIIPWLHEGEGLVRCQHGLMPIPVPAVTAIAGKYGLTLRPAGIQGELVTPTGAAIAACFQGETRLPERYRIVKCGVGAGKREYGLPGILRIMLLDTEDDKEERLVKLETDMDDCSGETLGYCMERLFAAGARDVHYVPIFMKKNRPAYQMQVICSEKQAPLLEDIIFRETTTIGIRRIAIERTVLEREIITVDTSWGPVRAKVCVKDGSKKVYPEYEDVASLCREKHLPFAKTFQKISGECCRAVETL